MVRGRVSVSDLISVTEYHAFINGKVADMHATTADATPATYTSASSSIFKSAFITPLLKKPDLDLADVKSYRPISNLSV